MPEAAIIETSCKLNQKQVLFCKYYIIDFNATQAAIQAGYSRKTAYSQGQRLLKHVEIQSQLQREIKNRAKRIDITQDRVLQELALLGFSDMGDFFEIEEGGQARMKTLAELPDGASRVIKSIEENRFIKESSDGKQMYVIDKVKFQLHDKIRPLLALGNHMGLKFDRFHLNGKIKQAMDHGFSFNDLLKAFNAAYTSGNNKPKKRN